MFCCGSLNDYLLCMSHLCKRTSLWTVLLVTKIYFFNTFFYYHFLRIIYNVLFLYKKGYQFSLLNPINCIYYLFSETWLLTLTKLYKSNFTIYKIENCLFNDIFIETIEKWKISLDLFDLPFFMGSIVKQKTTYNIWYNYDIIFYFIIKNSVLIWYMIFFCETTKKMVFR